jgi:hypothetical protein
VETEHGSRYPEESSGILNMNGVVTCERGPLHMFLDYLCHFYSHWHG